MATVLLSAAGAAIGSGFGGSVLGLSGAVIGRAIGATVGRSLDQRLLGGGGDAVEVGKLDSLRLSGASYGSPIREVWGRMRVPGQIIWATRFKENTQTSGGGKGTSRAGSTTTFSYTISMAIALCRGRALALGRIWADGTEISTEGLDLRFYDGAEDQMPDPKIAAVEGPDLAPAYRGIAYVVFEDLQISRFGNRVPQFSFEVTRDAQPASQTDSLAFSDIVRSVALIPGTGEYALATTPVYFSEAPGRNSSANVHTIEGASDFEVSFRQLRGELPNCDSISLVVSWFGNDLRCGRCLIRPKVEQKDIDAANMPWRVSGLSRSAAEMVPRRSGKSIYGGSPSDQSVIEAIAHIRAAGKEVMFYPFILMDQVEGNTLTDPWTGNVEQPSMPWRGRITLDTAPGQPGSTDKTAGAAAEVADFLGNAQVADFTVVGNTVTYSGSQDWGYRRFILHYAHLCALAGGVDAFCIGSELRGLSQIRASANAFPMVDALRTLASEVRGILGPETKISYAADWSEYSGVRSGSDVLFHLDPLWADSNIDFIGIDNYMPVSSWHDEGNFTSDGQSIYDLGYLEANIAGGEGFDWYYQSAEARENDLRTPIVDTAYGEDWVFRYKDLKGWWSNLHFDRPDGARSTVPTAWVPQSKPIRFTEYGCAAVDKATNEPNKFLTTGSSESGLPLGSTGDVDEYIQLRYYQAMSRFWQLAENNPSSTLYAGTMIDFDRSHAWAWDARPYPEFPGNLSVWSDGADYLRGHWLNGRTSNQATSMVIQEILEDSGVVEHVDLDALHGCTKGYVIDAPQSGRAGLQSLVLAQDLEIAEVDGILRGSNLASANAFVLDEGTIVAKTPDGEQRPVTQSRLEAVERVRVSHFLAGGDFDVSTAEAVAPYASGTTVTSTDLSLLLRSGEANAIAERGLARAALGRDRLTLALGPRNLDVRAGSNVIYNGWTYHVDALEEGVALGIEARRIDFSVDRKVRERDEAVLRQSPVSTTPVGALFLDLPLIFGDEVPHQPHIAVSANPWPGSVSVWVGADDVSYALRTEVTLPTVLGTTQSVLARARADLFDHGSRLVVNIGGGELSSATELDVLNGSNIAAISFGTSMDYELIQFTQAQLIATDTYELSGLVRGLFGTDATSPSTWPTGSTFVLLGRHVPQVDLSLNEIGIPRYFRIGRSDLGYTDGNVLTRYETFGGLGLRPYSVAHLHGRAIGDGGIALSWLRRSRVGGDNWELSDIPLAEETERYSVRVVSGTNVVREALVDVPSWAYSAAMQAADSIASPYQIQVGQVSASFGVGPYSALNL